MKLKNNFDLISQSVKSFTAEINEDEKQMARDNMVDLEIDDAKEKANEEFQLVDGIHPDCDPDSPGVNIIGDPPN